MAPGLYILVYCRMYFEKALNQQKTVKLIKEGNMGNILVTGADGFIGSI
jgi:hypothetical protein